MQRSRGAGAGFGGLNGGGFKRQRQTRPTSRFESEEGTETTVRVDLSKLKVSTLRKYVRTFELQGVNPLGPKDELLAAVSKHFAQEVVDERKVLENLILSLKKGHQGQGR